MTAFGIFVLEYVRDHTVVNQWLASFDPEANDGRGHIQFNPDSDYALHFASQEDAIVYLSMVPAAHPLRDDGQPNRPLRTFNVEIRRLPDTPDSER